MKRRRRYQKGSLQLRKHAGRKVWTVLYYKPDGTRGYHTLGVASEMTKGEAQEAAEQFLREEVNGSDRKAGATRPPTVKEFLEETYLPFYRRQWKASTKLTTERRIRQHIAGDLGKLAIHSLGRGQLQDFLQTKADAGYSKSVVNQLKFDLRSIFRMARAERMLTADPTPALKTPRIFKRKDKPTMSEGQSATRSPRSLGARRSCYTWPSLSASAQARSWHSNADTSRRIAIRSRLISGYMRA